MKDMFNNLVNPVTNFLQRRKNIKLGDAIEAKHIDNVSITISKGAKVSDAFVSSKCSKLKNRNDFLMEALERGCSFAILLNLTPFGGNVRALNSAGDNVLGVVIEKNIDSNIGPDGLVRELIKRGADVNHVRKYFLQSNPVSEVSILDRVNRLYEDSCKKVDAIESVIRDVDSYKDMRDVVVDVGVKVGDYHKHMMVKYNSNLISLELIKNGAKTAEELAYNAGSDFQPNKAF